MSAHYDVLVIGAGPAGEGCAMRIKKSGKNVAVIDAKGCVGGACTHLGTIPSKALRHSVSQIIQYNTDNMFRAVGSPRWFSFSDVLKRAESIIQKQVSMRSTFYSRNRIKLYFGYAQFLNANTLEVSTQEGHIEILTADKFVIATGSSPIQHQRFPFDPRYMFNSDTILSLKETPRKITIIGAGVIGCEYASIFCGLGVKVDLVDSRSRLLSFLDEEISDALSYHLRDLGVVIHHNDVCENVEIDHDQVYVSLQSGKRIRSDVLLWCDGRSGNTDNLCLDKAGLSADSRGFLHVNERYQTDVEHIYAAGDVIGWPSLASASYDQGRSVGSAILGSEDFYLVKQVPAGIYTLPEISAVGKTEQQLIEEHVPYEIGISQFKTLARAQICNQTVGVLKILFHRETLEILGIHCFGDQAAEIIHIGQAIMNQEGEANSIEYFINTTFNYPTMAEAYRVAALNGVYKR